MEEGVLFNMEIYSANIEDLFADNITTRVSASRELVRIGNNISETLIHDTISIEEIFRIAYSIFQKSVQRVVTEFNKFDNVRKIEYFFISYQQSISQIDILSKYVFTYLEPEEAQKYLIQNKLQSYFFEISDFPIDDSFLLYANGFISDTISIEKLKLISNIVKRKYYDFNNPLTNGRNNVLHILELIDKKMFDDLNNNQNESQSTILETFKYILKMQTISSLFGEKIPSNSNLQKFIDRQIENLEILFENLSEIKISRITLDVLLSYFQKIHKDNEFKEIFLNYRAISFEENDWNNLLNQIDLSDTIYCSPHIDPIFANNHNENDWEKQYNYKLPINGIIGDITDVSVSRKLLKSLQTNFKNSIKDVQSFHTGLYKLFIYNHRLIWDSIYSEDQVGKFLHNHLSLVVLITQYTPDLEHFVDIFFIPFLIRRVAIFQSYWNVKLPVYSYLEGLILENLPHKQRKYCEKTLRECQSSFQNTSVVGNDKVIFSTISLQKDLYSFNIPSNTTIWINSNMKEIWNNHRTTNWKQYNLDRCMQYIELNSPFVTRNDNSINVQLQLPMSLASILCCFDEFDELDIMSIKRMLDITSEQENLLVKGLKTLINHNILLKDKSMVILNFRTPIPDTLLHHKNILTIE